ncbi:hypothetical protein F4780DRAFT_781792 [Xylariomycetidae sp. FL0641]|nr:hypothetical protein F4780DRAFT_781792 [Xylariomycetidae sp. FL0641]
MAYFVNGVEVIMPPPEGYVVDFENPSQIGRTEIFAVAITENIIAFLFLLQRLYTKLFIVGRFEADDYTCLVAWATSVAVQGHLLHLYEVKAAGVHAFEMPIERFVYFNKTMFSAGLLFVVTVGSSKATLCLFYRRLSPVKSFQYAVWATMVLITGGSIGLFFSLLLACHPIEAGWDPTLAATAECLNRSAIYVGIAVLGIVTDVILLVLPIPTIMKLQIRTKQKVSLVLLFVVGSITVVTSIVRLIILLPSITAVDQTRALASGQLWSCIESNLLIICMCLTTLRRFTNHIGLSVFGEKSTTENSEGPKLSYGLKTFGSSGPNQLKNSAIDRVMGTRGTRLDDEDDDHQGPYDHGPEHNVVIKGGRNRTTPTTSQSDGIGIDRYDSDEAILTSRTFTVQVEYDKRDKGFGV